MSSTTDRTDGEETTPDARENPGEWIRENEEWLREKANSDLDGAWVYKRLLHSEGLDP